MNKINREREQLQYKEKVRNLKKYLKKVIKEYRNNADHF